jgi:hypothetical protein
MSGLSHKSWWVVGLVASLAIVVVAVVHAAIPDASGVIHACYRSNGNLRLVDKSSCTSSETALTCSRYYVPRKAEGRYVVMRLLPQAKGELRYIIRSQEEPEREYTADASELRRVPSGR